MEEYDTKQRIILPFYYSMKGELISFFDFLHFCVVRLNIRQQSAEEYLAGYAPPTPPRRGCSYQREIERIDK